MEIILLCQMAWASSNREKKEVEKEQKNKDKIDVIEI